MSYWYHIGNAQERRRGRQTRGFHIFVFRVMLVVGPFGVQISQLPCERLYLRVLFTKRQMTNKKLGAVYRAARRSSSCIQLLQAMIDFFTSTSALPHLQIATACHGAMVHSWLSYLSGR